MRMVFYYWTVIGNNVLNNTGLYREVFMKYLRPHSADIVQDHRWHLTHISIGNKYKAKKLILLRPKNMVSKMSKHLLSKISKNLLCMLLTKMFCFICKHIFVVDGKWNTYTRTHIFLSSMRKVSKETFMRFISASAQHHWNVVHETIFLSQF